MKDLSMNIKETKIVLFADNTKILVTAENAQILQQKVNMVMNELPFHTRQERDLEKPQIKFGNMDIAYKLGTKFLGVHISGYIKWAAHVRSLSSKLNTFCYMVKSLN
jgi:hypothetical protein